MADEGHLQVIEAMMVSMLLLGAAYSVLAFKLPTSEKDRTRSELARLVKDGLTVLRGLHTSRGNELDAEILDALQGNSSNITLKIGSYLPTGAAYAIVFDNGAQERELYRATTPAGESVTDGIGFAPDWNVTFVATELSCYDAGMDANATLVPIYHAVVQNATAGNAKMTGGASVTGVRSNAMNNTWNVTLPGASRPASGDVTAAITAKRGALAGASGYGSCALSGKGPSLVTALRSAKVAPRAVAPAGGSVTFDVDVTALRAVAGVVYTTANITLYDPLPLVGNATDAYVLNATLAVPAGNTATVTWNTPGSSLYGAHPFVLRADLTVSGVPVQARVVGVVQVALPNGIVPLDPPYRLALQAWFRDWR